MKYDYLISFCYIDKKSYGIGNMLIERSNKIKYTGDIRFLREHIKKECDSEKIAIISYQIIRRHLR